MKRMSEWKQKRGEKNSQNAGRWLNTPSENLLICELFITNKNINSVFSPFHPSFPLMYEWNEKREIMLLTFNTQKQGKEN